VSNYKTLPDTGHTTPVGRNRQPTSASGRFTGDRLSMSTPIISAAVCAMIV
jgi:hypothetical protein